ncbi:MAG: RnfABCDGE type electron transport complex subunit G [Verrucomicrobia bacterium]|nr:RnfABCDGE type electron transport complex subunit G [Verrucomicrobiota bacterium]MCH8527752.1 RnfABCDGE type electron transport complex subunit G [Kiritimatiellia bacterium]
MSDAVNAGIEFPPQPSPFRLVATLGGIAILSGLLVVMTYQWTKPEIERNQREALERAVFSVLPGAVRSEPVEVAGQTVFAGFDADDTRIGFALPGEARGYQGIVGILYGFDPMQNRIIGMTVLQSTETPGLGDKIIRDPAFHANFEALDVSREVEVVKSGAKTEPWQIDGISGATVSSQAVGQAIRRGSEMREAVLALEPTDPTDQSDPTDLSDPSEGGLQ